MTLEQIEQLQGAFTQQFNQMTRVEYLSPSKYKYICFVDDSTVYTVQPFQQVNQANAFRDGSVVWKNKKIRLAKDIKALNIADVPDEHLDGWYIVWDGAAAIGTAAEKVKIGVRI
jgi:hypothetical protein